MNYRNCIFLLKLFQLYLVNLRMKDIHILLNSPRVLFQSLRLYFELTSKFLILKTAFGNLTSFHVVLYA